MITLKEIIKDTDFDSLPKDIQDNLAVLVDKINKIRAAWGKPMIVTSGLRTEKDQKRINPKAMKSNHLKGAAIDIADPKGELAEWNKKNIKLLEEIGLWIEHPDDTPGWEHYQIFPPRSGNRMFHP